MFKYFQKMIVRTYQDSTRRQNNFENARRYQSLWGGGPNKDSKNIGVWWVESLEFFEVPEN